MTHATRCPMVRKLWPRWMERWCDCGALELEPDDDDETEDYCAEWGHATDVRDGVLMSWCPRCGNTISTREW